MLNVAKRCGERGYHRWAHLSKPVNGVLRLLDAHLGERLREGWHDCVLQVPGRHFLLHQPPQGQRDARTHAAAAPNAGLTA